MAVPVEFRFQHVKIFHECVLGSGAYGMVCRAKCDQLPCAAKLLHPNLIALEGQGNWVTSKFAQECAFLSSIKHPNIVQFLGVHKEIDGRQIALLMELMDESLTMFLEGLAPDQMVPLRIQVDICHDVTLALNYLHNNGIVHRDLSSNNVLLVAGRRAKITDFGMSKLISSSPLSSMSSLTQVPGCPVYMPPEAWLSPPVYTEKLDIFSLGVLMIQIATKKRPSPGPSEVLIPDERSPTGFLKLPVPEVERRESDIMHVSPSHMLRTTMLSCLSDKTNLRPSSRELCHMLEKCMDSKQYKESSTKCLELSSSSAVSLLSDSTSDIQQQLQCKESELQLLRNQVSDLKGVISGLRGQVSSKDAVIEELNKKLEHYESPQRKSKQSTLLSDGVEELSLSGLSPEMLFVVSQDPHSHLFNFDYDQHTGRATFFIHSQLQRKTESLKTFVQVYQHVFNSGQVRVVFNLIPPSFPRHFLEQCLSICRKEHTNCSFEHMESIDAIKVVSQSPEHAKLSSQLVRDQISLTLTLPGGQIISLKKGDLVVEDVVAIANPTNTNLYKVHGMSAALNACSQFEMQKHCEEYVRKHGPVRVGQVAHTKAGGNLKCEWLIHCVTSTSALAREKQNPKLVSELDRIMRELVTNMIQKAEKLRVGSLAFPPVGPGLLDPDSTGTSATVIIDTLLHYKYQSSLLGDVRLVVANDAVYDAYADIFLKRSVQLTSERYLALGQGGHGHHSSSSSCKQQ